MKLVRRKFLELAGGVVAAAAFPQFASADDYPARPVRIIAGFVAGGGVDITARLIGQWLADRLGQSFVVENRAGAGGNIGTEAVVNAAPDGYTLLLATVPNAVNASLYDKLNFDFIRGIAPVGGNMVHVPYRGQGPALSDLLGGQVQVLFATAPGTTDYISTGKLRALAVTSASRAEVLPELPTVADSVPGYETNQWYGICAPGNTPAEIVDKLNKEINAAIADPGMKARFAAIGGEPLPGSPAEFGKLIAEETEKWAKVVRAAGIKPE